MVTEIAQFRPQPGKADELKAGLIRGLEVVRRGKGVRQARLRQCVEDPELFIYEVDWETLEDHIVRFRGGPLFAEYRSNITGLFIDPVQVNHYQTVE